jgi:hypothetical protein
MILVYKGILRFLAAPGMKGMKNKDLRDKDPSLSLGMTVQIRGKKGSDGASPGEPPSLPHISKTACHSE